MWPMIETYIQHLAESATQAELPTPDQIASKSGGHVRWRTGGRWTLEFDQGVFRAADFEHETYSGGSQLRITFIPRLTKAPLASLSREPGQCGLASV